MAAAAASLAGIEGVVVDTVVLAPEVDGVAACADVVCLSRFPCDT